jgi:hypothetical protein
MHTEVHSNCAHPVPRAEQIARLNDLLRMTGCGGQVVVTQGIQSLVGSEIKALLTALAAFDDFDADSDPHGERDLGIFDFEGAEVLWKIDYYADGDLLLGSDDPADASVTQRVLTIMLAEEY